MSAASPPLTKRLPRFWLFHVLLPIAFFVAAYLLMPVEQVFQFDTDEGIELVRASLYARGFEFYTEIWSDHPPLFSVLLVQWQQWFGDSLVAARCLVLSFATLLVWAFAQTLRLWVGDAIALLATLMLANSINFLRLSVSVMIGLPAIALAMLAVFATVRYCQAPRGSWIWLFLSAAAFATSLQIKVFTGFLLPILLGYILLANWPRVAARWPAAIAPLLWLLAVALVFGAIAWWLDFDDAARLAQFQLQGDLKTKFVRENSLLDVTVMLLQELDYTLLAGLGAIALWQRQGWLARLPLFWLVLATALMLNHKPLWYHHYLLLSLPLTWLAAVGVKLALERLQGNGWRWRPQPGELRARGSHLGVWASLVLLLAIAVAPIKFAATQLQNRAFLQETVAQQAVAAQISTYQDDTRWLFTDIPMYGAATDLPLPPPIAAISRKRVAAGEMSPDYVAALVRQYRPEQFVLGRFPEVREPLRPYLDAHYRELPLQAGAHHWVRRDLWRAKQRTEREGFEPSMEPKTP